MIIIENDKLIQDDSLELVLKSYLSHDDHLMNELFYHQHHVNYHHLKYQNPNYLMKYHSNTIGKRVG